MDACIPVLSKFSSLKEKERLSDLRERLVLLSGLSLPSPTWNLNRMSEKWERSFSFHKMGSRKCGERNQHKY